MHEPNIWAAWTLRSHDELTGALPAGLGLRDVAALTLVGNHAGWELMVADAACRLCDWPACTRCPVDESVAESP